MYKAIFTEQPQRIKYMQKPNGKADVWLRADIKQVTVEHEGTECIQWEAQETFVGDTDLTLAQVEADFFNLFVEADKVQRELTAMVQEYMDKAVMARGYDGILSACSYVDTGVEKFDTEGAKCREWRSAVWAKCYEVLDDVLQGNRAVPTAEELLAMLPKLEW